MRWRDAIRFAVSSLWAHGIRTVLTILGFGVGVGAVLTVLTLGKAGELRVEDEIAKLGVNKVWIRTKDELHRFNQNDALAVQNATNAPACASVYTETIIRTDHQALLVQVAGFDEGMQVVHAPKLLSGRKFKATEFEEGACVCLVDEVLAEQLDGSVIGERIVIGQRRPVIIGVVKRMSMQTMAGGCGLVILPIKTYQETLGGDVSEITLSIQQGQQAETVADLALSALGSGEHYRTDTLTTEINAAREVVRVFVMVLLCVAVVCMLTGGIGVMNVLLMSVRERQHEIGLIKSIGGTARQVGILFLLEASAYALFGGMFGTVLGITMIGIFGHWIGLQAQLMVSTVLPVVVAGTVLGSTFGVAPAVKAAGMAPVQALRRE